LRLNSLRVFDGKILTNLRKERESKIKDQEKEQSICASSLNWYLLQALVHLPLGEAGLEIERRLSKDLLEEKQQ